MLFSKRKIFDFIEEFRSIFGDIINAETTVIIPDKVSVTVQFLGLWCGVATNIFRDGNAIYADIELFDELISGTNPMDIIKSFPYPAISGKVLRKKVLGTESIIEEFELWGCALVEHNISPSIPPLQIKDEK